ncbi:hypothetical protein BDW62DRAFT_217114 [Aspergillus aurantiobrunneus]
MSLCRRLAALLPRRRLSAASPTTTVLVVGAGSTGLALAQGLKKAGIPCIVVERDESIDARPRDWNMGLHWGADSLRALIPSSLWARLQSVQVDPSTPTAPVDAIQFLNGQTGELMSSIPARNFHRLRRRKLRFLLAEGLDIRFAHPITNITYSRNGKLATAHFANHPSITASLIVGTDGARSATRSLLLGPNAAIRSLPYCATFIHARYPRDKALFLRSFHPLFLAAINPAGYFAFLGLQDVPDPEDPESWTFFFYISWASSLEEQQETARWSKAQRLAQGKQLATHFADPWKSAYEWLDDDQAEVWYNPLTDFDPSTESHRWNNHNCRVTLAGDAAHPMTYQRGQGLNHAVTDAGKLFGAIQEFVSGRKTRAEAVGAYEEEMIARGGEEVRMSATNTEMVHDWQKVLQSPVIRNGLTRVGEVKRRAG